MNKILIIILYAGLMTYGSVFGQTKIDFDAFSYSGYEYNVFKSPENLFDNNANDYIAKNKLLVSDNFMDLGYNAKLEVTERRKYNFELNSDFTYRNYFGYSSLNQKDFSLGTLYERYLMRNLIAGAEYTFKWKDKLGTTVTGDELVTSFKYFSNTWEINLQYAFMKNLELYFRTSYEYKNYYDDGSVTPLDNSIINFVVKTDYELNRTHGFNLELGFANKHYKHLAAYNKSGTEMIIYDNTGNPIPGYPLRELNYFDAQLGYDLKIIRGLLISPGFSFDRRSDIYQDYYSYTSFSPDLKLRYMNSKWYVASKISYKKLNYDEKFAYTLIQASNLLEYKYFKYDLKARYRLSKPIELFLNFSSDSRDTNSELEYKRTRRPYFNYELSLGINASLNITKPNIFK